VIPELRQFMIPDSRDFLIPDFRDFLIPGFRDFLIPDFRENHTSRNRLKVRIQGPCSAIIFMFIQKTCETSETR
jgi:hypothetical protein